MTMSSTGADLRLEQIDVALQGVAILRQINLNVAAGEMVVLVGRNGAGKTTTLRTIMGLVMPTRGELHYAGRSITRLPAYRRAAMGVGYMPEDRRLNPLFTVEENLLLPVWAQKRSDGASRLDKVYQVIPEVAEFRARKTLQLSGGQQKLVALGRALMTGDQLLLLDEPFEGVAPALARRLTDVISASRAMGRSILLAQSEHGHAQSISDRVVNIERGEITR
jgi:branched-chain amino acid transport system ATP-binding protein